MARPAECDQVLLGILTGVAAKLFVVDFQVRQRATELTPPAIATQHLRPESFIGRWIQARAQRIGAFWAHDASSLELPRNACRCFSVRNVKNLVIENSRVFGCTGHAGRVRRATPAWVQHSAPFTMSRG
ncbi:MAG: hypothetical protein WB660_18115 [Candidatus Sulfotelmatobacter sp.]